MIFEHIGYLTRVGADLVVVELGHNFGLWTTVKKQHFITKLCINVAVEAIVDDVHFSICEPSVRIFALTLF